MALKHNIRLRGTRFHFRRKLTSELAARFGRAEIICSLRTSSARLAAIRAREAWLAIEEVIRHVTDKPTITKEQIAEMVRQALESMAWADEVVLARDGRFLSIEGPAPKGAEADILESYAEDYWTDLARNNIEPVRDLIETNAGKLNVKVAPGSVDERLIGRAMLKAVADSLDSAAARFRREILPYLPDTDADRMKLELEILDELESAIGRPPEQSKSGSDLDQEPPKRDDRQVDVMERSLLHSQGALQPFSLSLAEFPDATHLTFSAAWAAYREDLLAREEADQNSLNHEHSSIKLWIEVENDRPIGLYRKSDAAYFRQKIAQLPNLYHRDTIYRGKSVDEIIEIAKRRQEQHEKKHSGKKKADDVYVEPLIKRVAPKTVNRHISTLSSVFKWCVESGKLPESYAGLFAGLIKQQKKSKYRIQEERNVWSRAQIKKFFMSPVYTGRKSAARFKESGSLILRDWHFWAPLIGAYTGMRREEVSTIGLSMSCRKTAFGISTCGVLPRN